MKASRWQHEDAEGFAARFWSRRARVLCCHSAGRLPSVMTPSNLRGNGARGRTRSLSRVPWRIRCD